MTRAAELFCNRRSRFGRSGHVSDLGLGSSPERNFHHSFGHRHHNHGHHRRDSDGCDLLRRSPHLRHNSNHISHSEREPVRLNEGIGHTNSGNSTNIETSIYGPRLARSDRLPGDVLLARERLLQRLRSVSLPETRQNSVSSTAHRPRFMISNNLSPVNSRDMEPETATGSTPLAELTSQMENLQLSQQSKKNPPGLMRDALTSLHLEIFITTEQCVDQEAPRASWDCSICLESFTDGDELIRLPCRHRFHSACLDPWIRESENCPYCRRGIR